jgi:hypothetical protein
MAGIDLAKSGNNFFGKTVSEIFALRIGAEVIERKHGQGYTIRRELRPAGDLNWGDEVVPLTRNGANVAILPPLFPKNST